MSAWRRDQRTVRGGEYRGERAYLLRLTVILTCRHLTSAHEFMKKRAAPVVSTAPVSPATTTNSSINHHHRHHLPSTVTTDLSALTAVTSAGITVSISILRHPLLTAATSIAITSPSLPPALPQPLHPHSLLYHLLAFHHRYLRYHRHHQGYSHRHGQCRPCYLASTLLHDHHRLARVRRQHCRFTVSIVFSTVATPPPSPPRPPPPSLPSRHLPHHCLCHHRCHHRRCYLYHHLPHLHGYETLHSHRYHPPHRCHPTPGTLTPPGIAISISTVSCSIPPMSS